jgi:D-sedoheptulose 7-phosphate isomerase
MITGNSPEALVRQRIEESLRLKEALLRDTRFQAEIGEVGAVLVRALQRGHKVLFFGNGGSAADAQHLAAELTGKFQLDRPALPGLALTVNTSLLTAVGNDYSFDYVFARQLESLGVPGDVAFAISTSGTSPNVLRGVAAARKKGLVTIALTGRAGGGLKQLVDYCLCIPSDDTPRIQEGHILTGHILGEIVERGLFGEPGCFS